MLEGVLESPTKFTLEAGVNFARVENGLQIKAATLKEIKLKLEMSTSLKVAIYGSMDLKIKENDVINLSGKFFYLYNNNQKFQIKFYPHWTLHIHM